MLPSTVQKQIEFQHSICKRLLLVYKAVQLGTAVKETIRCVVGSFTQKETMFVQLAFRLAKLSGATTYKEQLVKVLEMLSVTEP